MSLPKRLRSFCMRDLETWRKFKEVCQREGESCSEKIEELIAAYVKKKYPGNPQAPIERYLTAPKLPDCPEYDVRYCLTLYWSCFRKKRFRCVVREKGIVPSSPGSEPW